MLLDGRMNNKNEGMASMLICDLKPDEQIETIGYGMLNNNKIPGILPITFFQFDEERQLKFNVSGLISLKDYMGTTINRVKTLNIFSSICSVLQESEEYLMDQSYFLYDTKYIMIDISSGTANLIYFPVIREEEPLNLRDFFLNLLVKIKSDTSEDTTYKVEMMNYLADDNFVLSKFTEIINELKKQKVVKTSRPSHVQNTVQPAVTQSSVTYKEEKKTEQPSIKPNQVLSNQNLQLSPEKEDIHETLNEEPEEEPKVSRFGFGSLFKKKEPAHQASQEEKTGGFRGLFNTPADTDEGKDLYDDLGFAVPGMEKNPYENAANNLSQNTNKEQSSIQNNYEREQPKPEIKKQPEVNNYSNQNNQQKVQESQSRFIANGLTVALDQAMLPKGTTVLNKDMLQKTMANPHLVRAKNNEVIPIRKDEFRIGREPSYADYCITDNSAISSAHANILTKDNRYFIIDTNSSNFSYINGTRIDSYKEFEIFDGDRIQLADEEFKFKLK